MCQLVLGLVGLVRLGVDITWPGVTLSVVAGGLQTPDASLQI